MTILESPLFILLCGDKIRALPHPLPKNVNDQYPITKTGLPQAVHSPQQAIRQPRHLMLEHKILL
jgi:hypothetical protein